MKNMLLLLLALIVVPAWAAEFVPAPAASEASTQAVQAAPKHKAKKHKKKKAAAKAAVAAPLTCMKQVCGGVAGCFQSRCGAPCTC